MAAPKVQKKEKPSPPPLKGGTDVPAPTTVKVEGVTLKIQEGGQQKSKYDLDVTSATIKAARDTQFLDYVEEGEARQHMMTWLGYINPTLVINLSVNLARKLTLTEVRLLGGPDGDVRQVCQWLATAAMGDAKVSEFGDLSPGAQGKCWFNPGWGLRLPHKGPLVYILDLLKGSNPRPLDEALLSCRPGQVSLSGNQVVVVTADGVTNKAGGVSGRPWHIHPDGGVSPLHGPMGLFNKELVRAQQALVLEAKQKGEEFEEAKWRFDPFTMNVGILFEDARNRQTRLRQQVLTARADATGNLAANLLRGKILNVARQAPIVSHKR